MRTAIPRVVQHLRSYQHNGFTLSLELVLTALSCKWQADKSIAPKVRMYFQA